MSRKQTMPVAAYTSQPKVRRAATEPGTTGARPRILHVTGEYPDPISSFKTPVIKTLLDLTSEHFDHRVISINRRAPPALSFVRDAAVSLGRTSFVARAQAISEGVAIAYEAPPFGVCHKTKLRQLGEWIINRCLQTEVPDLLVAHKLTIEGIAVRHAATCLGVPFAVSIQGRTDTRILGARPDLAAEFAKIFHDAEIVFPFTPWALRKVEGRLGKRRGPTVMLPCATDLDQPLPPEPGGDGLVSAFHLKNRAQKNLSGMVAAIQLLREQNSDMRLSIVGGGESRDLELCKSDAKGMREIVFEGHLDRQALRSRLNRATAFILPSFRETFGLVFVEALFAGLPIIYPKGSAVDGYFDGCPFALRVDARDPHSIAGAMKTVVSEEARLKGALAEWQNSAHARQFTRDAIGRSFAQGLSVSLRRG